MTTPSLFGPPSPDPLLAAQPVGPVVDVADGRWGVATATFSACRTWRYRLSRVWDPAGSRCVFVMLNPSTADHLQLDPTVRRCAGFAREWGHGALEVVNCFALRSTDPDGLRRVDDPVGPGNDDAIAAAAEAADLVVVAWGVHATLGGRDHRVAEILADVGCTPMALATTKDGHPGHPLYLPGDVRPVPWTVRAAG